jgi:RimJ/RimL family protein N-acetyltransferase
LCDPGLGPVVAESQHWNLVLNKRIQNALEGGARETDGPRDRTAGIDVIGLPDSVRACLFDAGIGTTFAMVLREGGALVGTVSLYTRAPDGTAVLGEGGTGLLGFWLGVPYWNKGYATEAVAEVVRYGFKERSLLRIRANHFGTNAASGRVLRKVGMRHVGTRPNYYEKWGNTEDREEYVLLARDWCATEGR